MDNLNISDMSSSFAGGMDSLTNPLLLPNGQYIYGENILKRGGIAQTRWGVNTLFTLPCGQVQGGILFHTTDGDPMLVFAVAGNVYYSHYPYDYYQQIPGIRFYKNALQIAWAITQQSTAYDSTGQFYALNPPRFVLMMQDGFSRAAWWDGHNGGHLDPSPSGVTDPRTGDAVVLPGTYGTPPGLWMAWASNRLFVSRGTQVFASDIGNPLVFSEQLYLSLLPSFNFPGPVTGMVQPYNNAPLQVFTASTRSTLRADIQNRKLWADTPQFQVDYYGIGCVAARSIVRQYGLVWWYSQGGLVNLNQATQNLIDSYAPYFDDPMAASKAYISPNKQIICGASMEKYLLLSVPSGSLRNRHTWSLDQFADSFAWDGVMTGFWPVEWMVGYVVGEQRCFFVSMDEDGVNHLSEAFIPDRTDNGQPISCQLQTRYHNFSEVFPPNQKIYPVGSGAMEFNKDFRYENIQMAQLQGTVDVMAGFTNTRSMGYKKNLTVRLEATQGYADLPPVGDPVVGYRPQVRTLLSTDNPYLPGGPKAGPEECFNCGVETKDNYFTDRGFGVLVAWSGIGGVTNVRVFGLLGQRDKFEGACMANESGDHIVEQTGCMADTPDMPQTALPEFTASATAETTPPDGVWGIGGEGAASATSIISQLDAQRKAEGDALLDAMSQEQFF